MALAKDADCLFTSFAFSVPPSYCHFPIYYIVEYCSSLPLYQTVAVFPYLTVGCPSVMKSSATLIHDSCVECKVMAVTNSRDVRDICADRFHTNIHFLGFLTHPASTECSHTPDRSEMNELVSPSTQNRFGENGIMSCHCSYHTECLMMNECEYL